MLTRLAMGAGALVAGLLAYANSKPKQFRVERSLRIHAPASIIFAQLSDFERWTAWSPWEARDPQMKRTYENGAYSWEGNKDVGAGRMQVKEAVEPSRLAIQLDFFRPFRAQNTAEFTLQPDGEATVVTWAMYGPSPLISRVMSLFFDMDAMIGKDFETGLASLRAVCEGTS